MRDKWPPGYDGSVLHVPISQEGNKLHAVKAIISLIGYILLIPYQIVLGSSYT